MWWSPNLMDGVTRSHGLEPILLYLLGYFCFRRSRWGVSHGGMRQELDLFHFAVLMDLSKTDHR